MYLPRHGFDKGADILPHESQEMVGVVYMELFQQGDTTNDEGWSI